MSLENLLASARSWIADDPDEVTRAELESDVAAAESGDAAALDDLADRFRGLLAFGTAGLRGALGAGPNRMNRVVVLRAAAGLTRYLQTSLGKRDVTVVIGYDARTNSDVFAADTAAVVTAAGGRALVLPRPLATPVLAFAIRYVGADAGVMVTASHNPPQDNGYKVYLGDGSQIVPPADVEIARRIAAVGAVADVPRGGPGKVVGEDLVDTYLDTVAELAVDGPRDLRHHVGGVAAHDEQPPTERGVQRPERPVEVGAPGRPRRFQQCGVEHEEGERGLRGVAGGQERRLVAHPQVAAGQEPERLG